MVFRASRRAAICVGLASFLVGVQALAWVFEIQFGATVNDHKFHRIKAEGNECALKVKLSFTAPEREYDSRAKNRNYHRFKARVLFQNGKAIVTPVFGNSAPGKRAYTYTHDTSGEACWAKEKTAVKDIDIEGCRARGCKVKEFGTVLPVYGE